MTYQQIPFFRLNKIIKDCNVQRQIYEGGLRLIAVDQEEPVGLILPSSELENLDFLQTSEHPWRTKHFPIACITLDHLYIWKAEFQRDDLHAVYLSRYATMRIALLSSKFCPQLNRSLVGDLFVPREDSL